MVQRTTDVYDDITVGELGNGLRNDGLAAAESTGDGDGTSLHTREQGVEDSLANNEGLVGGTLLGHGSGYTDGPGLQHAVGGGGAVKLNLEDLLLDGIFSLFGDLGDGTPGARGQQDLVDPDEGVLEDGSPDVTTGDVIADLGGGGELPLLSAVDGRGVDSTGDVDTLTLFLNLL